MNTNIQSEISKNIIELFEINKLPEDKQDETIAKIGKIIFQSVLMRVLPTLSEEDLTQYENLIKEETEPDVLFNFFFEKVPSFLQIVAEEAENFKRESTEVLKQIS